MIRFIPRVGNPGASSGHFLPPAADTYDLGSTTFEWDNVYLGNDGGLLIGLDQDVRLYHRATAIAVDEGDTDLAALFPGTANHPAIAANSLIVSNITSDGDIILVVNDGGNARGVFKIDADVARVLISTGAGAPVPSELLHVWSASGDVAIKVETGAAGTAFLRLDGTQTSNATVGSIFFINAGDSVASIRAVRSGADDAATLEFVTQANGGSLTNRMTLGTDGATLAFQQDITISNTSGDITVDPTASFNVTLTTNDADAVTFNDGATDYYNLHTGTAASGTVHQFDTTTPSFASSASAHFHLMGLNAFTWTVTGGVQITTPVDGLGLRILAPVINSTSATILDQISTLYVAATDVSDAEITANLNLAVEFDGSVLLSSGFIRIADALSIDTGVLNDDYYIFRAVDNDDLSLKEVLRVSGANDPYVGLGAGGAGLKVTAANLVGFFGVTPVNRPGAFTQTYSTGDKTVANPVAAAVGDLVATSGGWGASSEVNFDKIATAIDNLITDNLDLRQAVTSIIDDLQELGLLQ